jgi:hypothetical protein
MIDNPVHDGILREEGDDLHAAATLGAEHGVNLIDLERGNDRGPD